MSTLPSKMVRMKFYMFNISKGNLKSSNLHGTWILPTKQNEIVKGCRISMDQGLTSSVGLYNLSKLIKWNHPINIKIIKSISTWPFCTALSTKQSVSRRLYSLAIQKSFSGVPFWAWRGGQFSMSIRGGGGHSSWNSSGEHERCLIKKIHVNLVFTLWNTKTHLKKSSFALHDNFWC